VHVSMLVLIELDGMIASAEREARGLGPTESDCRIRLEDHIARSRQLLRLIISEGFLGTALISPSTDAGRSTARSKLFAG